jgi:hypothetical protein
MRSSRHWRMRGIARLLSRNESTVPFDQFVSPCTDLRPPVRKMVGRGSVQVGSVRETVTSHEEVRPMNATRWVLPLVFAVERLS